jgi:iron complex outermembrane recepter protein
LSTLNKRNPIANAVRTALFATAAAGVIAAPTTFAAEGDEAAADEQKVTITGSRIKRTDIETASLVSITPAEEIKLSGFTRIEDLMNSLPQVEAAQTSFIANGATGTASIDLRGMGTNRTLVLINGRRMQPGGINTNAPDVNQIPAALVERVEVLTGGGSSTYGADAVAGVVNFVMDNNFEGVEITAGYSGFQHDNSNSYIQGLMDARGFEYPTGDSGLGGETTNLDIAMGGSFDGGRGHATGYITYRKINELRQAERDYSSCALSGSGLACGGSGNAIVPNFFMGTIDPVTGDSDYNGFSDFWTLAPTGGGFTIPSSGNVYNYAPVNHFMRPDKRYTLGAFIEYEVNEHVRPYMEVSFMRDRTAAQIAESGTFFNEEYRIDYDSPLISDAQRAQLTSELGVVSGEEFAVYIGKRNVEGGPRADILEHNSFRMVFGSEGDINDMWSYDASIQYGSTSSSSNYKNDFLAPNIVTALSANGESCAATAGCIPYEVFTFNGVTPAQASTLTATAIQNGITEQFVVNGFVSGDLDISMPSAESTMAAVFGLEYREETFDRVSDELYEKGLLLGQGGPTVSLGGEYDVTEVFGELSIPVVEGVTGIDSLTVDLGFRYSDYSNFGTEPTYKIGVDWAINEDWKIRGSYNRAVRAPNNIELFLPQNLGLWQGVDPCGGATPALSAAQCANTGVTAAQYGNIALSPASQYNQLGGGNPDLKPEIADTMTFGLVGNPIENLNFTVDYFDIQIDEVIGAIGAELTVNQCATTGLAAFCDNVIRGTAGSLWVGQTGFVRATQVNLASRHWQGVDVNVNHKFEALDGTFTTKLVGTFMTKKEFEPLPGTPTATYDCVGVINSANNCFAQPEWRHSLTTTYDPGSFWTVSAKWRYFGEVDYDDPVSPTTGFQPDRLLQQRGGLSAESYFDVKASFEVNENVGVLFGINNILDEEPPMVGSNLSSNANTVAGFYDTLGRFIHASVTLKF